MLSERMLATTATHVRRGLLRGWVVLAIIWIIAALSFSAWRIFSEPSCYAFDSITLNDDYKGQDLSYVKNLRDELLKTQAFCGAQTSTQLLSLESYAKDKAFSQVSFAWKEPSGWSTDTNAMLDVLDGKEITVSRINSDVAGFVHKARFLNQLPFLLIMILLPFLALGIGVGIFWTILGFRKS